MIKHVVSANGTIGTRLASRVRRLAVARKRRLKRERVIYRKLNA